MATATRNLGELTGPLLIFGGPYSNLQATLAMRKIADELDIPASHIICTGDMVAYCADASATLDLIRDWGINLIQGNCEESLSNNAPDCGCGFVPGTTCSLLAGDWYDHARRQVSAAHRAWMGELPRRLDLVWLGHRIAVVHGGVETINRFIFPSSAAELKERELDLAQTDILIAGHCGLPFGQMHTERAWLNAGAIGLPANDGTRNGWYMLLEPTGTGGGLASWHRLAFDATSAATAMRSQGLTGGYDRALLTGLWPSLDVLPEQERQRQGIRLTIEPLII